MSKFALCFCLVALFVLPVEGAASDSGKNSCLLEFGIPQEIIDALPDNSKTDIYNAIQKDEEKVFVSTSKMVVDNLAEIESFMSYTDEELVNAGVSYSKVQEYRTLLKEMYSMTEAELSVAYDFSAVETKLFKKAYESGVSKVGKMGEIDSSKYGITTSGTITSSEMTYSTIAIDGSSQSSIPVYYTVNCAYAWTSPFNIVLFDDCIAAVWGGYLHESNISGLSAYNYAPWGYWEGVYTYKTMTLIDQAPNQHFLLEFPQAVDNKMTKSGSVVFNLSSNTRQGNSSYVITRYGHKHISVTSPSITWGSPSVSFGTAYNQTPVESGRYPITY